MTAMPFGLRQRRAREGKRKRSEFRAKVAKPLATPFRVIGNWLNRFVLALTKPMRDFDLIDPARMVEKTEDQG